jgi:hypothetical protein
LRSSVQGAYCSKHVLLFFRGPRKRCVRLAKKGPREITNKRVHSRINPIETCCLLSCPDNKNCVHHLILSNVGPVRFGPDDLVDLALMPGRPARAVSFHTPSGNLFEDSSTTDFCGRSLPLLWLADPFDGRPVEKPLSNQACPTPSKTFTCIQKTTSRTLSADS